MILDLDIPLEKLIHTISQSKEFRDLITYKKVLKEIKPCYGKFPQSIHSKLRDVLRDKGIIHPYIHQEIAMEYVLSDKNIGVVTPTASGKTLCYNLPVLNYLIQNPEGRALYMFPTKALSQDQLKELQDLITLAGLSVKTFTYDGDTPDSARQAIRAQGSIIITNPDMLHQGILPHHTRWQKVFQNLKFIVIDEVHTYRGVFGSHVCNVIRRLKRICTFYQSCPTFILTSATIANPRELAQALIEEPVELIDKNGAPQSQKTFFFINPPVINKELNIRTSPLTVSRKLARLFIEKNIQTIVFTGSRLHVEVLTKYLKDIFDKKHHKEEKIRGYRGGYLPLRRREIEKGLKEGIIKGVVSTNALELGIDIGELDICIMAGYPGSIASTWQQSGRAGRRQGSSAVFLIARSLPTDQFIIQNPSYFFGSSPEQGRINPDNLLILVSHIKCAAFELPFNEKESFGSENLTEILNYLVDEGILNKSGSLWHWMADAYPADSVSLRSASAENFIVIDGTDKSTVIAEVDFDSAPLVIHEGAMYMVEAKQYHVDKLDFENRLAFVHEVESDYYTDAISYTNVRILDEFQSLKSGYVTSEHGEVHVLTHVSGFKKIKFYTTENVGYGDVTLPDNEMITTSYWFTIEQDIFHELNLNRQQAVDAVYGISYALKHVAAIAMMCDVRDLGTTVGDKSAQWQSALAPGGKINYYTNTHGKISSVLIDDFQAFQPTLFIYDRYPGGAGFSQALWQIHQKLLHNALHLISRCQCHAGCPSCVGAVNEVGEECKSNAMKVLERILGIIQVKKGM
jgi:DEAD/DEAH box helicase domain-containing protein